MQMCDQFPVTRTLQNSLQNLKQEIYRYQLTMFPLCANTFLLYLCFMTWASGVYAHTYDDEQNLRHSILANYTPGIRPVIQQSQPTTVMVEFRLMEILSFDDRAGVLKTMCILTLQWMDEKIRWNASMYDIWLLFLTPTSVWMPRLFLNDAATQNMHIETGDNDDSQVRLSFNGMAIYSYAGLSTTRCDASIMYFPFDQHTCELNFLSYEHTDRVIFLTSDLPFNLPEYTNKEWEVQSVKKSHSILSLSNGVNHSNIKITIQFKRKPGFVILNIFVPIPCFGIINILVFLLPESSGERISFSITILLTLVFFLNLVADCLPPISDPVSIFNIVIMTQVQNSLLIVIATIFSLVAYENAQKEKEVPYVLSCIISMVGKSVKRKNKVETTPACHPEEDILPFPDKNTDEPVEKDDLKIDQPTWDTVSDLCNRFCLRSFLFLFSIEWLVYIILMVSYCYFTPLI